MALTKIRKKVSFFENSGNNNSIKGVGKPFEGFPAIEVYLCLNSKEIAEIGGIS